MPVVTTLAPTTPYCVQCAGCERYVDTLFFPVFSDPDGNSYCGACNHWFTCAGCGDLTDQHVTAECASGRDLCDDCYCERYTHCEGCGEEVCRDDCSDVNGRPICEYCARECGNWDVSGWRNSSGRFDRIGSKRCFGVEIETAACDNHTELFGDAAWGAKEDCSVSGKEFVSDVFSGDDGLAEVQSLCNFAGRNDWHVDSACGLHVHLDARGESDDSLKSAACAYVASYAVWAEFVDSDRLNNHYCGPSSADCDEISRVSSFADFARYASRYEWINFSAYRRHTTFEVRLHHGSINAKEICNWIRAHAVYMDWAVKQSLSYITGTFARLSKAGMFRKMCAIWTAAGCADLCEYYGCKGGLDWATTSEYTVSSYTAGRIAELQVVAAGRGIR